MRLKHLLGAVACLLLTLYCPALRAQSAVQAPARDVVLQSLEDELRRSKQALDQKGDPPPYYLSYYAADTRTTFITASFGALRNSQSTRARVLDVEVRVGNYELDSTHQQRGQGGGHRFPSAPVSLPVEDDPHALRSVIWLETDRKYRDAVERLIQVRTARAVKVQEEDESADFSREEPHKITLPAAEVSFDKPLWEKRARAASALFTAYPDILQADFFLTGEQTTKYLVSSEGASLRHGSNNFRIVLAARTKAVDGMDLFRYESFEARTPDRLPNQAALKAAVEKIAKDLQALRAAPVTDAYTGPAILSGRASGVFFHEIFGHRIEGQRQKDERDGQTFTKKIKQFVLPDFLSVYDDPTLPKLSGVDLNGHYLYDDEGVPAQRVTVVKDGILETFLLSRSPVKGFEKSNGHGRKSPGFAPAGRQGNLIVEAAQAVPAAKLRELLIEECRRQNKPYGLYFEEISGGFTFTGRSSPQAFQVTPLMVYRVYTDGQPDELVRGVDLIGTPLAAFSKIVASGDRQEVFNGICGAESGWVPVAAVAPSILTTQIEVQKRAKSSERPPVLPSPRVRAQSPE